MILSRNILADHGSKVKLTGNVHLQPINKLKVSSGGLLYY